MILVYLSLFFSFSRCISGCHRWLNPLPKCEQFYPFFERSKYMHLLLLVLLQIYDSANYVLSGRKNGYCMENCLIFVSVWLNVMNNAIFRWLHILTHKYRPFLVQPLLMSITASTQSKVKWEHLESKKSAPKMKSNLARCHLGQPPTVLVSVH